MNAIHSNIIYPFRFRIYTLVWNACNISNTCCSMLTRRHPLFFWMNFCPVSFIICYRDFLSDKLSPTKSYIHTYVPSLTNLVLIYNLSSRVGTSYYFKNYSSLYSTFYSTCYTVYNIVYLTYFSNLFPFLFFVIIYKKHTQTTFWRMYRKIREKKLTYHSSKY